MPFASLQRLARIGFWLVAAAILALSLVPGTLRPHTLLHGEAEHFAAYFALGVTLGSATATASGRVRRRSSSSRCRPCSNSRKLSCPGGIPSRSISS